MGVQGLWPLLEPVGRRVNIDALANKKLAVGEWLAACCAGTAYYVILRNTGSDWVVMYYQPHSFQIPELNKMSVAKYHLVRYACTCSL